MQHVYKIFVVLKAKMFTFIADDNHECEKAKSVD